MTIFRPQILPIYIVKRQLRGGGGGQKSPILTPQKKTSGHIFKMAIFSKFFDDVM